MTFHAVSPFGHPHFLNTGTNFNIAKQFFSTANPKTFALARQDEKIVNLLESLQGVCYTWRFWNEVYRPTRLADERHTETGKQYLDPAKLLQWQLKEYIKHSHKYYLNGGNEEQTACKRLQLKWLSTSPNSRLGTRPWPTYLHQSGYLDHLCQEHIHPSHSKSECLIPSRTLSKNDEDTKNMKPTQIYAQTLLHYGTNVGQLIRPKIGASTVPPFRKEMPLQTKESLTNLIHTLLFQSNKKFRPTTSTELFSVQGEQYLEDVQRVTARVITPEYFDTVLKMLFAFQDKQKSQKSPHTASVWLCWSAFVDFENCWVLAQHTKAIKNLPQPPPAASAKQAPDSNSYMSFENNATSSISYSILYEDVDAMIHVQNNDNDDLFADDSSQDNSFIHVPTVISKSTAESYFSATTPQWQHNTPPYTPPRSDPDLEYEELTDDENWNQIEIRSDNAHPRCVSTACETPACSNVSHSRKGKQLKLRSNLNVAVETLTNNGHPSQKGTPRKSVDSNKYNYQITTRSRSRSRVEYNETPSLTMAKQQALMAIESSPSDSYTPQHPRTRGQTRAQQLFESIRNLTPIGRPTTPSENIDNETIFHAQEEAAEETKTSAEDTTTTPTPTQEPTTSSVPKPGPVTELLSNEPTNAISNTEIFEDKNSETNTLNKEEKLAHDNTFEVLQQQVRETVNEMNDDLDDDDTIDDSIFAEDLVLAARNLLDEGKSSCHFSARKLQNWIKEVEESYKPQFDSLRPSTELTAAYQDFEQLIEDAYQVHTRWQKEELESRVHSETQAMHRIKSRRDKLQQKKEAQKLTRHLKQKLHLDTSHSQNEDATSEITETINNTTAPPTFPSTPAEAYELDHQNGNTYW
jgi:hypothetical protein